MAITLDQAKAAGLLKPKKKSKFRNVRTARDGLKFDSKAEANRYTDLKARQEAGEIRDLIHHKAYHLTIGGELVCKYEADFVYYDIQRGVQVVEDVKGVVTEVFRIKARLMKLLAGIEVEIVKA